MVQDWKKQNLWKKRMGNPTDRTPSPNKGKNKLNEDLGLRSPPKNRKRLSIDKRNGIDSHLLRDSYNSRMHMLRKNPSKRSEFELENNQKTQYWKSLINKKWDSLRCRNLKRRGESPLAQFKKSLKRK